MNQKSMTFRQKALIPAMAIGTSFAIAAPMAMAAPLPAPTAEVASCTHYNPCAAPSAVPQAIRVLLTDHLIRPNSNGGDTTASPPFLV